MRRRQVFGLSRRSGAINSAASRSSGRTQTCTGLMVLRRRSCKTDGVSEQAAGQIHPPEVWSPAPPGYDVAITPIMRPYPITLLYLLGRASAIRILGPAFQQQLLQITRRTCL